MNGVGGRGGNEGRGREGEGRDPVPGGCGTRENKGIFAKINDIENPTLQMHNHEQYTCVRVYICDAITIMDGASLVSKNLRSHTSVNCVMF